MKIATRDGVEISATFYEPDATAKGAVLIAPAMLDALWRAHLLPEMQAG